MNKKILYISIIITVLIIIGGVLYYLNTAVKEIGKDHVKIKFKINLVEPLYGQLESVKKQFLQPLLTSHFQVKSDGTEELFITSVTIDKATFCIPVYGINCFRYDENSPLSQSTYTSTSRISDENSFFETWDGGTSLEKLMNLLHKGNKKGLLPDFSLILNQSKLKFIDSLIICKDCSDAFIQKNSPFIFKSASDLRKYVNQQIEKFPQAIDSKEHFNTINIFIFSNKIENNNEPFLEVEKDELPIENVEEFEEDGKDGGTKFPPPLPSPPLKEQNPNVQFQKRIATDNDILFTISNYKLKESDEVKVNIYHNNKLSKPKTLNSEEIRSGKFRLSGKGLSDLIGLKGEKLYVNLELVLNGETISTKSSLISIYCNLP